MNRQRSHFLPATRLPATRLPATLCPAALCPAALCPAALAVATMVSLISGASQSAADVVVPFSESFSTGDSGWVAQTSLTPTWSPTGGVDNDGFISMSQAVSTGGFGSIIFRGNNANDASNDAFVGDWLGAGVQQFSASIRHDAPESIGMFLRFDRGAGAGASTQSFLVPGGNTWTQVTIPMIDSPAVFQSFGAAGPGGFGVVFADIQNVQVALSSSQSASVSGNTYTFGLDHVSITAIPEPSSFACAWMGSSYWFLRRKKRSG